MKSLPQTQGCDRALPMGAVWDGSGTHFSLFSAGATAVELCLFDTGVDERESVRIPLVAGGDGLWRAYLPEVRPGQLYGYRVHGPYLPAAGHRFNPAKLLIDPYARAVTGRLRWHPALVGGSDGLPCEHPPPAAFDDVRTNANSAVAGGAGAEAGAAAGTSADEPGAGGGEARPDPRDSAPFTPRCVVVDPAFDWEGDKRPALPWKDTLIYECHVKGLTALHPDLPPAERGTYSGLASEPVIAHLRALGVTAVELMPVQHSSTERHLVAHGLDNYWGYSPIAYFAPDARFASTSHGEQVVEFRNMVKRLHAAGIEVILDVVFNHTGEEGRDGATVCLRGVDNATYYRLAAEDKRRYVDYTGCGNSLEIAHPQTLRLVADSLRYWVEEMHVDGFRFDLAPALARERGLPDTRSAFFKLLYQDPLLSAVKLIAEPWDLGEHGYRLGDFPPGWAEWNGRYRDTVRRWWRGDRGQVGELASRLAGSSDIFGAGGRRTDAGVNFVASHDGFTLSDLLSYERKHNEANMEGNRDGNDHEHSRNWGEEGRECKPAVRRMRERMARNFIATLAFSQGIPMLCHGDEMGRSQSGNNNAYCQDNEITWIDWALSPSQKSLLTFTRRAFALRRAAPQLRQSDFLTGLAAHEGGPKDVAWLRPDGAEFDGSDWHNPNTRVLGMLLSDGAARFLLLLLNASGRSCRFALPAVQAPGRWRELLCTASDSAAARTYGREHPAASVAAGEAARFAAAEAARVAPAEVARVAPAEAARFAAAEATAPAAAAGGTAAPAEGAAGGTASDAAVPAEACGVAGSNTSGPNALRLPEHSLMLLSYGEPL